MWTKSARIDLFDLGFFLRRDFVFHVHHRKVDGVAVGVGGDRDVVDVLVAALNFQAVDADVDQFWNLLKRV